MHGTKDRSPVPTTHLSVKNSHDIREVPISYFSVYDTHSYNMLTHEDSEPINKKLL